MSVLEQMSEWVAAREGVPLSQNIRKRLAIHLLDAVGAWIAGGAVEEGKKLARLSSRPSTAITLFGNQPLDRIALGVATTRLTEIDDIHMPSCTTPSSVVVPVALIVARSLQGRDSMSFVHALSTGYEVMARFGAAIAGPAILSQGIWPTYFAAPLCAAAVTARLLGLTANETANALGIAITMASGTPGKPVGASPRWLLLGMAARSGCAAAIAAAEGYAGDLSLLDGDWMMRAHGIRCDIALLLTNSIGDGAISELSLKPYCAAKQTTAAIDAFRNLIGNGIFPNDIVSARVSVPPAYAEMIGHRNAAAGRIGRITSAAYQLALAAYRPDELENVARPNLAADPEVAAFMSRVEVVADETLAQYYPQRWPARVEIALKNGKTKSNLVLDANGDPVATSELDVKAKFHRLADGIIGVAAANELAEACLNATENEDALAVVCAKMYA